MNLLIFFIYLCSRFTVSALHFNKFNAFRTQCTHFISFVSTSDCGVNGVGWPAAFGRWNYLTCIICILAVSTVFSLFLANFDGLYVHLVVAWLQIDFFISGNNAVFICFKRQLHFLTFDTNTHSYTISNEPKTRLSRSLLPARMCDCW